MDSSERERERVCVCVCVVSLRVFGQMSACAAPTPRKHARTHHVRSHRACDEGEARGGAVHVPVDTGTHAGRLLVGP